MKELKTYISEGFFANVGANNIIKPVIDTIKDASLNDKIDSDDEKLKFVDLLTPILKDLETNIKKGKLVFEYTRNDRLFANYKTMISLEILEPNDVRWTYSNKYGKMVLSVKDIAFSIAIDLYHEVVQPTKTIRLRHSIANTIEVTKFKVS